MKLFRSILPFLLLPFVAQAQAPIKDGAISKIFTTNLIYRTPELLSREWYCEVNLCKYVALIIDTLNHDMTISDLLNPVNRIHNLMDRVNKTQ